MFKQEFIFRHENGEFKAWVNPIHLRQAAAVALAETEAQFMEIADKDTGETLMVCVHRQGNPNGFKFLFPED